METINFKLKILSPVFIGSGNKLSPLNYIIKGHFLYKIKESNYIKYLLNDNKDRFLNVINSDNIGNINRYYLDNFDETNKDLYYCKLPVVTDFINKYNSIINSYDNQGLIDEFICNSLNGKPYIPGSTLKGSLRTVILSNLLQNQNNYDDRSGDIEFSLLKAFNDRGQASITEDPFKFLKINDMFFEDNLKVCKNENVKPGRNSSIPEFREILMPSEKTINGQIIVHKDFETYFATKLNVKISNMKEYLIKCLNDFYKPVIITDKAFFENMRGYSINDIITKLDTALRLNNKSVIRIGKGQGKISFSIYNQLSKTRNVVEKMPLGWCEVDFS